MVKRWICQYYQYYLSLPYQANGFSSLTNVSAFLWPASLLMSYVGSSDKFRAIVCGPAIRPLMRPRYPHCQLPRPPISLLSTEETKSAPGNIFFQSIKSRILCGIISYCALMAPSEMLFLACYFQLSKKRLLFCDLSCTSPSTFFSWWGYRSILSLVHNWRLNISSFTSSTSDCWCHCSHMQPWWWGGQ